VKTRLAIIVASLLACLAVGAATASAAVSIPSFTVSLSNTQAGSSPDVAAAARFSTSSGDALKDALISLPPGLLFNPNAATVCPAANFQAGNCPSSSRIGDGTVTATELAVGGVQFQVGLYLISPQGAELARIGLVAPASGSPAIRVSAPVTFRGGSNPGLNVFLTGIPNQIGGLPARVDALSLRLFGSVNGKAFTRLPTSCGVAQTLLSIDSYQVAPTAATAASSFTPAGCGSLSYQPQLALSASVDPSDNGIAFRASLSQAPGEAATSSVALFLPSGLAPNRSALSSGCSASDLSTCPTMGTATATTPLLAAPVTGRLVLAAGGALYAVFPPPLALTLPGTASVSGNALQLTFSGFPDVPFTGLEFNLSGGSGSLLTVGDGLCSGPLTVGGQLASHSGATTPVNAGLSLSGCRNFGPGSKRPASSGASFSGLATGHPKLHFQASNVTTMSLALPRGLSFSRPYRGRGLVLSGAKLKNMRLSHGRLVITLRAQAARVGVTITAPLLRESAGLVRKVKNRQAKSGIVSLKLTGRAGQTSLLRKLKLK
jgi:hypothetical protein